MSDWLPDASKLDQLARNVAFIANQMDAGVEFPADDQPFASRPALHILASMAENEVRRTSARTKAPCRLSKRAVESRQPE